MIIEAIVPKSWGEVSLRVFEDLSKAVAVNPSNPYELTARTIAALTQKPYDEVRQWPVSVLGSSELADALSFVNKEPKKRMPSEKIVLDGKEFKVCIYPQKWSAGQWLDYTSVAKDENENQKMAKLIACFTIPDGHEYGKGYDFDEIVETINDNMDIETALGLANFFQLQFDAFTKALAAYSARKLKKLLKSTRKQARRSNENPETQMEKDTPLNGQAS